MKTTTDLFFAAFLKKEGYALADFVVVGNRRGKFRFTISDEDYKNMKVKFINSDISKIKQIIEELKDLMY